MPVFLRLGTIDVTTQGVRPMLGNFVTGAGVAGVDNTAQVVQTIVMPANTLTTLGGRVRIRCYWKGDSGAGITGTLKVNDVVTVATTTDLGAATFQVAEAWLHYIDATHANIISMSGGAIDTVLSNNNAAGFNFAADQNITISQDAIGNNHIVVFFFAADVFPKVTI